MKYVALLRGINVGGNRKVEMRKLKTLLESLDCKNVSTYINSGNAIFESALGSEKIRSQIEKVLKENFGFEVGTIVRSEKDIKQITKAIPLAWQNDSEQKTDVAYLFPKADYPGILNELPVKKEFIDIRYTKGALIWNVKKTNYNRSQLGKLIGHKMYKLMTVRNVNTARFLGGIKK